MGSITKQLISQIENCKRCSTITSYQKFPSFSHGNSNAKYLLVSEAPGSESLLKEQYWVGTGGQILRESAKIACVVLEDLFYLTDIVKCWPSDSFGKNRTPFPSEISNCSTFLLHEINVLKPQLILSLGKPSSSFLMNRDVKVKSEHGRVYRYNNETKILVMLHPANIDRHMKRSLYIDQLSKVLMKLKEEKLNDINQIFKP